jgi:hypothetical protein
MSFKKWLIKKLGGYTSDEYANKVRDASSTATVHLVPYNIITLRAEEILPNYPNMDEDFTTEAAEYALKNVARKIADDLVQAHYIKKELYYDPNFNRRILKCTFQVVCRED